MIETIREFIGKLNLRAASIILIILPASFLVFHTLIIIGILPRNIVWGGRLTDATFLPLELLAIVLNMLLMATGAVASGFVAAIFVIKLVDYIKWFLFYFVLVNTIFALFSTTTLEVLMTPVTALYALCLYRVSGFSDGLGSKPSVQA